MSDNMMPKQVDAIVIGSGGLGASTAYHLVKAGLAVALIDKAELASQTSPRAAGLSGMLRSNEAMTRIAAKSVEMIEGFAAETGEPMVYYQPGALKVARLPEHEAQLHEEVERGQGLGLDVALISLEEAQRLMPYLETTGVRAVMHMRRDVYLEPVQIPLGYARASGKLGAALLPNTRVEEILVSGGTVAGVRTAKGDIRAPVVVDAAGAWLRLVASFGGSTVKLVPTRHQLMITVPLPKVHPNQPITRVIDANVYIRPEKGGLMLGGYEPDPVQYDMAELPPDFRIEDLALDISVLRRLAESVAAQFPIFRNIELQEHRGGLPTMTADGEHVLGPAPGVAGLFVIGGCCVGGLSTAPALGSLLAELDHDRQHLAGHVPRWRRTGWRPGCRRPSWTGFAGCNMRTITGRRRRCPWPLGIQWTIHRWPAAYAEIREEVAKLCARFPGEYWRKLDEVRGYPTEFVQALTESGYLRRLIPEEYGGAGLPLVGGRGDPRADPAQRLQQQRLSCPDVHHGHDPAARQRGAEGRVPAEDRVRRVAAAGVRSDRADERHRHHGAAHHGAARGRPLHRERAEDLDQPGRAFRSDAAAGPHDAARPGGQAHRGTVHVHRRYARPCWIAA